MPATNLIRFAPEATRPLMSFLDNVVKIRADEWEPRYNLDPVLFANVRIINLGQGQEAEPQRLEPFPSPNRPRHPLRQLPPPMATPQKAEMGEDSYGKGKMLFGGCEGARKSLARSLRSVIRPELRILGGLA